MNAPTSAARTIWTLSAAVVVVAGVVLVGTSKHSGALPSQFIVYTNTPGGGISTIWRMDPDGSNKVQLTTSSGFEPAISPDGSKIVFTSNRDYVEPWCCDEPPPDSPGPNPESLGDGEEIYVMNADGSNQTRITTNESRDIAPSWSPDGSKIIFQSNQTGQWQIFTINPSGGDLTRITTTSSNEGQPQFSPDGSKIVFTSTRSGEGQIWTMNADGSSPFRVTQDSYSDDYPAWSPDGRLIAFTSERSSGGADTYTITPAGTDESAGLTSLFTQLPQWSSDSSRIVVQSPRDGNWDVYSMKVDGTDQVRLTTDAGLDMSPFWGPGVPGFTGTDSSSTTTAVPNPVQSAPTLGSNPRHQIVASWSLLNPSQITGRVLWYRAKASVTGTSPWLGRCKGGPSETSCTIKGLLSNTTYDVRVRVQMIAGTGKSRTTVWSAWSASQSIRLN